jgi:integrase
MSTAGSTWATVAPNIYDDGRCFVARAKVGTQKRNKRFARTTPLREINAWLEDARVALRKEGRTQQRLKGTLAGEVAAYVNGLPKGRARNNTRAELSAWAAALGAVSHKGLTEPRLRAVVNDWIGAGVAASTLKHRRRGLAQFLEAHQARELAAIVRTLKLPRPPKPQARGLDVELLHAILIAMDPTRTRRHPGRGGRGFRNQARARLLMMLWTGLSPASLKRLSPHAIDLTPRVGAPLGTITLPPRLKGEGAEAVTVPLFGKAPIACQEWQRAFAWGSFDQRALGRAFHTAVRTYVARETEAGRTVTLPADLRPYDLRHSFGSWFWTVCKDLAIVQEYMQHSDLSLTQRYTRGAVSARMAEIANAQVAHGRAG